MAKPQFVGDLPLGQVILRPDNERSYYNPGKMAQLKKSIQEEGQLQPIVVEKFKRKQLEKYLQIKLSPDNKIYYLVLSGNRRTLAKKELGHINIAGMVFEGLTHELRIKIMIIENFHKVKILSHENAKALWEYYLWLLGNLVEGQDALQLWTQYGERSWQDLPDDLKKTLTIANTARITGKGKKTIKRALRFTNLHGTLVKAVKKDALPYSWGSELGRLPKKYQQQALQRFVRAGQLDKNLSDHYQAQNLKNLTRFVGQELKRLKQTNSHFSLSTQASINHAEKSATLRKELIRGRRYCNSFCQIIEVYPPIIQYQGFLNDILGSIDETINQHLKTIDLFLQEAEPSLLDSLKKRRIKPRLLWHEGILLGEQVEAVSMVRDLLSGAKHMMVYHWQIQPDANNPRLTFTEEDISTLAESFEEVGILQPILLRPIGWQTTDGHKHKTYCILAGHRRFQAALKAGYKRLYCLVTDQVDEEDARIIQFAEDLFEEVAACDRARRLKELFELQQKERGQKFTEIQFAEENKSLGVLTVLNDLRFARLPIEIQRLSEFGLLSRGSAIMLPEIKNSDLQLELALEAILHGFTQKKLATRLKEICDTIQTSFPGFLDEQVQKKGRRKKFIDQFSLLLTSIKNLEYKKNQYKNNPEIVEQTIILQKSLQNLQTVILEAKKKINNPKLK